MSSPTVRTFTTRSRSNVIHPSLRLLETYLSNRSDELVRCLGFGVDLMENSKLETTGQRPTEFQTKTTATKEQFLTGAHRSSAEGRGRPQDLSPLALLRLGKLLERGANAYGARNYQKGMSMDRTAGSLLRHLLQYMSGDCDEDHLAAVMFNAMVLLDTDERVRTGLVPKEMKDI